MHVVIVRNSALFSVVRSFRNPVLSLWKWISR